MKTIGIIGGTTWHSTIDYYRILNEEVQKRLGGKNTARVIINSVNFQVLADYSQNNDWESVENYLAGFAKDLEKAGAECHLLGANTLHKVADSLSKKINIPIINIAEETAKVIQRKGMKRVALLGTKFTMTADFYKDIMQKSGIEIILPEEKEMDLIHNSIYEEFSQGIFTDEMKKAYLKIINKLIDKGAEGVILGCTEIPILIKPEDVSVPVFDTTLIHTNAAIEFALK